MKTVWPAIEPRRLAHKQRDVRTNTGVPAVAAVAAPTPAAHGNLTLSLHVRHTHDDEEEASSELTGPQLISKQGSSSRGSSRGSSSAHTHIYMKKESKMNISTKK